MISNRLNKVNKIIILDRDGTINEDIGDFCSLEKLIFIPRAIDSLKILQQKFLLFIITNQSGIEKKLFSEKEFLKFNNQYLSILKNEGVEIKQVYDCPHTKEERCICRKPKTYFIKGIIGDVHKSINKLTGKDGTESSWFT